MEYNKVYLGDAIESVKTFPDECFDCVVTSPPYYGLRDYGTGEWVGGDPNCDHEAARKKQRFDYPLQTGGIVYLGTNAGSSFSKYEKVCPVCGAVRVDSQIGLEDSPEAYIERLVSLFRQIRRCLKKDGTLWVNLGDSYNCYKGNASSPNFDTKYVGGDKGGAHPARESGYGLQSKNMKAKDLMGIPWMFAFAMRADGWYLRQDIIWAKPNPMPESVTDRCTKSHEYIFLFSKSEKYYFDNEAIMEECSEKQAESYKGKKRYGSGTKTTRTHEQGYSQDENGGHRDNSGGFDCEMKVKDGVVVRNKRDVWTVCIRPNKEAHFATYPQELIAPCILAGSRENGVVLDPFMGSGTTGIVARKLNRNFVGCELNPEYQKMAERRIFNEGENLFNI